MKRLLAVLQLLLAGAAGAQELPKSSLAVHTTSGWKTWWRSSTAPAEWRNQSLIIRDALRWNTILPGLDLAELRLAGRGEAWRIRVIVVRLDPSVMHARLVKQTRDEGTLGAWAVDSARQPGIVAVNAGQFSDGTPWGWLIRNGVEESLPGIGPLSLALVAEVNRGARLIAVDSIERLRADGRVVMAFQSYPTLIENGGIVPIALRSLNRGLDLRHRDSRVAIGELRDGRLLVVVTRFEGLGGVLSELPFGPTIPELAALMGALGCLEAVALDGGISGQLMVRTPDGTRMWKGMRRVPLGLVFYPSADITSDSTTLSRFSPP